MNLSDVYMPEVPWIPGHYWVKIDGVRDDVLQINYHDSEMWIFESGEPLERATMRNDLLWSRHPISDAASLLVLSREIRNCFALARRHRGEGDWMHIIRFCEGAGLKSSPLRAEGE